MHRTERMKVDFDLCNLNMLQKWDNAKVTVVAIQKCKTGAPS